MKSEQVFLLYIWLYINILNTNIKKNPHTIVIFNWKQNIHSLQ